MAVFAKCLPEASSAWRCTTIESTFWVDPVPKLTTTMSGELSEPNSSRSRSVQKDHPTRRRAERLVPGPLQDDQLKCLCNQRHSRFDIAGQCFGRWVQHHHWTRSRRGRSNWLPVVDNDSASIYGKPRWIHGFEGWGCCNVSR